MSAVAASDEKFQIPTEVPMASVVDAMQAQIGRLYYEVTVRDIRIAQLTQMLVEKGGQLTEGGQTE